MQPPLIIQIDLRTSTEIFIVNVSSDVKRFVLLDKLQEGTAEANVIAGKINKNQVLIGLTARLVRCLRYKEESAFRQPRIYIEH